ncbi:DUF4352 domain-containing protein [Litorihabitans aurantiacus]|uniref:DUF4352 domain-containing protein n=1 Tax=Litorihabitans aurantiacus TaxID=1930061 RepID=A0AA37XG49_9MICO|nr:DUF4352 domain-containing protein [Litorihabitans aurantiacus]GMA32625.1 hypothetical protein GCM10025875_26170 [Litorihabitans aurantiacus]
MQSNPFDPPQSFAQQGGAPAPQGGHAPQQPYATPPGQQPPAPPAPQEPRKRSWFARHKILTGLGALVVLGVVGGIAGSGGDDDGGGTTPSADTPATASADGEEAAPSDATEPAEPDAPEVAGIGTAVRDGKFEFTVTGVESGVPSIGNDVLGTTAQGQFVLVSVGVANIGDEAQSFLGDNATLVDDQGREHSADSTAAIYLENSESLYTQINPGNAVDTVVVFDIPAVAVPTAVELHDSMFSGGVTVSLQ